MLREGLSPSDVASEGDWRLIVGWLLAAIRPIGPYPILVLHGEQGSAKSTTARMLRELVDPNEAALRGQPRTIQDLMISARNTWILSYDNLSYLPPQLSDALCRVSTGGAFSARQLYTDDEEVILSVQRPVILNGIAEIATRGDLLDRALVLYLPHIEPAERRSEADFWADFAASRPRILGALLEAAAFAAVNVEDVRLPELPRMADFAKWVTAAEPALDWPEGSFSSAYTMSNATAATLVLDASPVGRPLLALLEKEPFTGTASDLLRSLARSAPEAASRRGWPESPLAMTKALRRLAPSLRGAGVELDGHQTSGSGSRKLIMLRKLEPPSSTRRPLKKRKRR